MTSWSCVRPWRSTWRTWGLYWLIYTSLDFAPSLPSVIFCSRRWSTLGTEYQQLESWQTHPRSRLFMLSLYQRMSSHCDLSLGRRHTIEGLFPISPPCKPTFPAHQEGSYVSMGQVLSTRLWWVEKELVGALFKPSQISLWSSYWRQMPLELALELFWHKSTQMGLHIPLPMRVALFHLMSEIMALQNWKLL